jgi:hypothetical protein
MAGCGPIWLCFFTVIVGPAAVADRVDVRFGGIFLTADDFAGILRNDCLRRYESD